MSFQKKIWEYEDVVDNETADFIERIAIHRSEYSLGKGAFGTSHISSEELNKAGLDNQIFEYMQFTQSIINRSNNDSYPDQVDIDYNIPFLIPLYSVLSKMNSYIGLSNIIRVKLNLQPKINEKDKSKFNFPHVDMPHGYKNYKPDTILTMIYYVNDSDGDTLFFNEEFTGNSSDLKNITVAKRVTPKKGKLIAFRSDIMHAGSHPVENDFRMAINYNVLINDLMLDTAPPKIIS